MFVQHRKIILNEFEKAFEILEKSWRVKYVGKNIKEIIMWIYPFTEPVKKLKITPFCSVLRLLKRSCKSLRQSDFSFGSRWGRKKKFRTWNGRNWLGLKNQRKYQNRPFPVADYKYSIRILIRCRFEPKKPNFKPKNGLHRLGWKNWIRSFFGSLISNTASDFLSDPHWDS